MLDSERVGDVPLIDGYNRLFDQRDDGSAYVRSSGTPDGDPFGVSEPSLDASKLRRGSKWQDRLIIPDETCSVVSGGLLPSLLNARQQRVP